MTKDKIGWKTATAIVIANMIGTGIFTSLGFQLVNTTSTFSILLLWLLGALMAIAGAFSYAELGTFFNRSGGEYHFLSKTYNPLIGYLSGWVSLTIGFSAPVALAAMALGKYLEPYSGISSTILAIASVIIVTIFHSISLNTSSKLQNFTTALKFILVSIFIISSNFIVPDTSSLDWSNRWQLEILTPAFAVSFVYVTFSYSGWNAAAYIVDDIKDVNRNLPKALIIGTLVVSIIYLLLNLVFLYQSPASDLVGQIEIGQIVAISMFGEWGGKLISLAIGMMLVSSISAMICTGPRVTQAMADDHRLWSWFSLHKGSNIPVRSIWLQLIITLVMVVSGTFEQVLLYSAFVLQLFSALAVAAVIKLRLSSASNSNYQSPWFPLPQIFFLILSVWVLIYILFSQPLETTFGLINLGVGCAVYFASKLLFKTD